MHAPYACVDMCMKTCMHQSTHPSRQTERQQSPAGRPAYVHRLFEFLGSVTASTGSRLHDCNFLESTLNPKLYTHRSTPNPKALDQTPPRQSHLRGVFHDDLIRGRQQLGKDRCLAEGSAKACAGIFSKSPPPSLERPEHG